VDQDDDEAEYGMDQTYSQRQAASSNPLENALGSAFFQQSKVVSLTISLSVSVSDHSVSASHRLALPSSLQSLGSPVLYLRWLVHI
jgi:hypothetical protein